MRHRLRIGDTELRTELRTEKTTEEKPDKDDSDLEEWRRALVNGAECSPQRNGPSSAYSGGATKPSHVVRLTCGERVSSNTRSRLKGPDQ
ncbi:hypothetical protein T11_14100 [Trichinella zimbabwensis]|uniref:Uncharacterized protein n=1 Tax=Trichinella zimbabwensis TaxID=268475 RepID=A0A0V1GVI3_9BILA|nr:hypothetical protein T11_14100 [Trichinella zimbabwensis]